jgi:hypothetical protein
MQAGEEEETPGLSYTDALQEDELYDTMDSHLVLADLKSDLLQLGQQHQHQQHQHPPGSKKKPSQHAAAPQGPAPAGSSIQATSAKTLHIINQVLPGIPGIQPRSGEPAAAAGSSAAAGQPPQVLPTVLLGQATGQAKAKALRDKLDQAVQQLHSLLPDQEATLRQLKQRSSLLQTQLAALSGGRLQAGSGHTASFRKDADGSAGEGEGGRVSSSRGPAQAAGRPVAMAVAKAMVEYLLQRTAAQVSMRPTPEQVRRPAAAVY